MPTETAAGIIPRKLYTIPAFPPIASRLMATFARKDVEVRAVADLIAKEPTFGSRVLQFANSAKFAFNSKITSVHHAVALLGLEEVRNATITLAAASMYKGSAAELARCWQHTLACGLLAEEIARATGQFRDQAYTAGVLHDIGRLGLVAAYPAEYQETVRMAASHSLDMLDFERERFGVDHCEVGRWLAERWGLPDEFRVIAGRHHDPPDGSELDLRTLVHVACRMADHLGYDVTTPLKPMELAELLEPIPEATRRRLAGDLDRIRKAIELHIGEYGACLPAQQDLEPAPVSQGLLDECGPDGFATTLPGAGEERAPRGLPWGVALFVLSALGGCLWFWLSRLR